MYLELRFSSYHRDNDPQNPSHYLQCVLHDDWTFSKCAASWTDIVLQYNWFLGFPWACCPDKIYPEVAREGLPGVPITVAEEPAIKPQGMFMVKSLPSGSDLETFIVRIEYGQSLAFLVLGELAF